MCWAQVLKSLQRPLQVEVVMQQRDIQRELEELEHYGKSAATPDGEACPTREASQALQQKLDVIDAKLAKFSQQVGLQILCSGAASAGSDWAQVLTFMDFSWNAQVSWVGLQRADCGCFSAGTKWGKASLLCFYFGYPCVLTPSP